MTPVRIFISSVVSEFAEERQRLYDYIRTDALLKLFFEPYLFEANPASDSKTQEIFLRAAGESEIYVGIWGLQYGNGDFRVTIMRPDKAGEGQSSGGVTSTNPTTNPTTTNAETTTSLLNLLKGGPLSSKELMERMGLKDKKSFREVYLSRALSCGLIEMTHPENQNHRNQKYRLTEFGKDVGHWEVLS